ncbi:MAG: A24 family peptidase [Pseudomonadota bacterium]
MSIDLIYILLALACVMIAFVTDASLYLSRSLLRASFGPMIARANASSFTIGLGLGAVCATLVAAIGFGSSTAIMAAALSLLCMLAAMDIVWRWLPTEWTASLTVLGLGAAAISGDLLTAFTGAALGGGILFSLRLVFLRLLNKEAMGLGDVWLATAIGSFVGPIYITWVLATAAIFGLALHLVLPAPKRNRLGVAFGSHICATGAIFMAF